ncbi:FAD-binding protein [Sphingomonas sp. So64.6b]|uniref:D-arabinono-1,4-lactone oxidase n=1 Tax=Sphingomonas sp. So64.6b TaxID=2997354 RepID=UPI001601A0D7|nr:D-arabinono-1,4-lactone oxidase [Sphingomonas sp. So64.6b]QNA84359.1 FAD-binding protein [Sphingomonas sp. So64.6b]
MSEWRNWSGSVVARPAEILRPTTEEELSRHVAQANKVRVVGAGHSFMPLCETDGLLLNLDALEGSIEIAPDGLSGWAPAGWSLARLTRALWDKGYSLPNQGDVNPQSLAGAISTGTHGTGAELGSLATFARAFRLVLADGSVVQCSRTERPELFEAQRLSLGLLGVVTRIEVDLVPAFHLQERLSVRPLAEIAAEWEELAVRHRHVEFWVFPYSDRAILKTLDICAPAPEPKTASDMSEGIFKFYCELAAAMPRLTPRLQHILMRLIGKSSRSGPAYSVFPSERSTRFEEMEYELPRAAGFAALNEVTEWIRRKRLPVSFPFEYRLVAADDIWLSPFNKGPGASVSMHQYAKMPWREIFAEAETIFRSHGGRPHWAKRHTLTAADVSALYPMADRFLTVRQQVDPAGKFANTHLTALFGIDPPAPQL